MQPLRWDYSSKRFAAMIGVGGVGSGMFFLLNGDHTLGREESRSGHFLKKNDYCKLHIISHYVKVLLGDGFHVIPLARVGDDEVGHRLIDEMKSVGIETSGVDIDPERHTLFSFCFLYPDRSGGNLTTDDSACSAVTRATVLRARSAFEQYGKTAVALAAPEVPFEARAALLELGAEHSSYTVASFTSEELGRPETKQMLRLVDLLCINLDEAASATGRSEKAVAPKVLVEAAVRLFTTIKPSMQVSVTMGKEGSYVWDGTALTFAPAFPIDAVSTAGAGDAFTAGLIAGKAVGLPLRESQELAALVGARSVTSPHTIDKDLDRVSLSALVKRHHFTISSHLQALLTERQ